MPIIQTACTCGKLVEIRTGSDSKFSNRNDGKQAVYPGEEGYTIFRCQDCRQPLNETVDEYAYEEPSQ